jgi:uncharacterized protein (TIGR02466 family)|tara:strand:+ start:106 stop:696 length:591 start_codon:yes stop_codon:yes gene_type:complete
MNNNIPGKYYFPYWGPLVFKTKVSRPDLTWISRFTKKAYHKKDAKDKLAGVIDDEFDISTSEFMKDLQPYLNLYYQAHNNYYNWNINKLTCTSAWINFMKAGEVNPMHMHPDSKLSCVLYVKIPKELKEENKNYVGKSVGPGGITFHYGEPREGSITQFNTFPEERDLLIFPGNLRHEVLPFRSKGKRISISANFM